MSKILNDYVFVSQFIDLSWFFFNVLCFNKYRLLWGETLREETYTRYKKLSNMTGVLFKTYIEIKAFCFSNWSTARFLSNRSIFKAIKIWISSTWPDCYEIILKKQSKWRKKHYYRLFTPTLFVILKICKESKWLK